MRAYQNEVLSLLYLERERKSENLARLCVKPSHPNDKVKIQMRPLSFCTPGMLSHRCRPSLFALYISPCLFTLHS